MTEQLTVVAHLRTRKWRLMNMICDPVSKR
jgi:hypothetical protein